ncbi:DnaB-like helicase C-terminal domain-containing protein [Alienimonas californiensis]|uniref:Replicative DNA helicase n=1 Tax=Alienimonas californiensis TaxID=2527989 RepID=A0A517P5F4_9PLAN|nr:DnaB-like helicase C-terminal domain-containing protein [Alienimonas californiensis]QDT14604.1 replicative DNA helicase [Alienimonas californiensis]
MSHYRSSESEFAPPPDARYTAGADAFAAWREELDSGSPPPQFELGQGFEGVNVGPGVVTLFGGGPGAGKTALVSQLMTDALRIDPNLRLLIANVEMPPSALLDRQLARISGVDLGTVRGRVFDEQHGERIEAVRPVLEDVVNRTAFLRPPFDLENIARSVDAEDAGVVVLDYLQRIRPPGTHGDSRGSVAATMDYLRRFADAGMAVVAVAAVARAKNDRGSSYDGLNLASFRESSEIEYGADDAFILAGKPGSPDRVLKHLKSRNGEPRDIPLRFEGAYQSFRAPGVGMHAPTAKTVELGDVDGLAERFEVAEPASDADEGGPCDVE